MTAYEPRSGTQQRRIYDALEELQGGRFHLAPLTRKAVAEHLAASLLPQHRFDVLSEAIEAARNQYLGEIDTPEDEAYHQGVSDVIASIAKLMEGK